jgi:gliding motility-associated-like protein
MRKFTPIFRLFIAGTFLFVLHPSLFTQNTPCAPVNLPNNMPAFQTYSTAGLNNSGVPYPGCGGNVTVDIWFAVVAPPSGDMDIALKSGTMVNMAMAFYKGPCNNLMFIDCTSDDNCGNPLVPAMQYDNLTPGTTYYIRIWPEGPGGNFQIRVTDGDPPQTPLNFTAVGSAQITSPYCIQLTTAAPNQAGCGWDPSPVNFSQPFTRQIVYNFGNLDPNGADGICMVFQNSPAGTSACGTGGGGIAYLGIPNSFIIEFDTWDNGPAVSDIPQDHTSININGIQTAINGPVPLNGGNIEDGQDHLITFSWTPATNAYTVTFDGIPVISGTYNIVANCFGGNPNAYYGVTASTGGSVNLQTACTPEPEIFPAGSEDTVYVQICQGETYFAGGTFQSNTGIYFDNFNAFNGCDSTIVTFLTVYPNSYYAFNAAVCQGGSVTVGNTTYTTTGVHTTTLTNWRGCDSIVVLNLTVLNPQAVIQSSGNITCNSPTVTLNGTGSSTGPGMTFQWTGPSPACISPSATSPIIQVSCPGTYTLTIKHQIGNVMCSSTTSITVTTNIEAIIVDVESADTLTCIVDCVTLDASGSTNGPGYNYSWTGPNNYSSNLLNPQVCAPGNYQLTIQNPSNGCFATGIVNVPENAALPIAQAGPDMTLNCHSPTVTLDGSGSSGGNNLEFTWLSGSTPIANTPDVAVTEPGIYFLTVLNPANNCTDQDTVLVDEDFATPAADAGANQTLDCTVSSVTLDGSGSSSGPGITYEWQNSAGLTLGNTTTLQADEAGTYVIIVVNTASGCSDTASVLVEQDLNSPVSNPGPDQTLTCTATTVTLDGSASSSGPEYTYEWQNAGGAPLGSDLTLDVGEKGSYFLLVTNTSNNCVDTAEVIVTIDTLAPVFDAGPDAALTCADPHVVIGDTLAPPVPGWLYEWIDEDGAAIGADPTQTVTQPGVYFLVVTGQQNGCSSQDSVTVTTDDALPVADAGPPATLTCTVNTISLGGTNSTGGPDITYSWTDAGGAEISTDPLTSTDVPGAFTLTVLNTANGCQSSDQVTIALDTIAPQAEAGPAQILNCANPDITLDGSASSQGAGYTYQWLLGGLVVGDAQSLTVSDSGMYVLVVLNNDNGCSQTDSALVSEDFAFPIADAGTDLIIDCGTNSVTLDGGASSLGAEFSYQWLLGGLVVGDVLSLSVSEAGDYIFEVTNTINGCVSADTAIVSLDANAPVADAGPDFVITCDVPQVVLDGSGSSQGPDVAYEWLSGGLVVGDALSLTISQAGDYTLQVTNLSNGCVSTSSAQVAVDTINPDADAGAGGVINCLVSEIGLGGQATSTGPEFVYEWLLGGLVVGDSLGLTVMQAGDYTLQVTDTGNGCIASSTATVLEDLGLPVADAGQDFQLNCFNPSGTLDGGGSSSGSDYAYEWLLGGLVVGNALSLPASQSGTYTLTVTNTTNGCQSSDEVVVSADFELPIANPGPDQLINCFQPNATLDGSASSAGPAFTYEWLLGGLVVGDALSLPVSQSGTYTLSVFNTENGCESSATVFVQEDFAAPVALAGPDLLLNCYNPSGTLNGGGSSSGAEYAYEWLLGGSVVGDALSLPASQSGTYILTVFNTENGCEASDEAVVTEDLQVPTASAGADLLITCDSPVASLDGTGSSAGLGFSYQWLLGGSVVGAGVTLPVTQGGTYTLTVTNFINGCSATDQVSVGVDQTYPQAVLTAGGVLTCVQTTVQLLTAGTSTGPEFAYEWNTLSGGTISTGPGALNASVEDPGTYQLIVLNTENGCADTAQVNILQDITPPVANAGAGGQLNCFLTSITLDGNGSQPAGQLAFAWSTTNGSLGGNAASASPSALAPGVYTLTVTNLQNGCTDTDQVTITSVALSGLEVSFTEPECQGDPAAISFDNLEGGKPPYSYSIDGGATFVSQTIFTGLPAGGYDLVVQDADGCTLAQNIFIADPPAVTVEVVPQLTLTLGESYQLNALTNIPQNELGSVSWTPAGGLSCSDCLDPVATPLQSATYTVVVTNLNGCSAQALVQVLVEKPELFIPNVFSPNFDGINDEFLVFSAPGALREIRQMRVFTRWGEKLFDAQSIQPNDIHAGWNGTFHGKIVDVGVYTWMAEVVWTDGSAEWLKGDVTVVR